jgi:hypothetical protein
MTVGEIIAEVDDLKPNTFDVAMKIRWLSQLDGKVYNDVICTHEADEKTKYHGHEEVSEELLVRDPYTDIYRYYLYAMMDYSNEETERYQNSMLMFNNAYQAFCNYYNRTHKPKAKPLVLF